MEQPKSLSDMSEHKVNKSVKEENNVDKLPLPKPIQEKLKDRWFHDFLLCDEKMPDWL